MRLLHLADVHLDTPFAGRSDEVRRRLREASREALRRAVACALAERVDVVLLAGDLFDGERMSFQTERFLVDELARLVEARIPVVYATGNHDPGRDAQRSRPLPWPPNVELVGDPEPRRIVVRDREGREIGHVTAAGHASRRETGDLAAAFPSASGESLPQVGLLHTQVVGSRAEDEHDPYAPSDLKRLTASGHDYWALGHVHLRQCLSEAPAVHYSGNTQGRTPRESGPKGGLLVEVRRGARAQVTFQPFGPVRFETVTVEGIENAETLDRLLARMRATWELARRDDPGEPGTDWMARFRFAGGTPAWRRLGEEEERAVLAHEIARELRLLDAVVQVGAVHPVVRVEEHRGRMDVLGVALRLIEDVRAGRSTVPGLHAEDLAGLDHADAGDAVAYVQGLLEGADGELIARMLESTGGTGGRAGR